MNDAQWIEHDEARVAVVYDDADGAPLKQGMTIKGHATWGVGHNGEVPACDAAIEAQFQHDLEVLGREPVQRLFPGHALLSDEVRFAAVTNMMFNCGETVFREFTTFVSLLDKGSYVAAAADLRGTLEYRRATARYERIAHALETGEWPVL